MRSGDIGRMSGRARRVGVVAAGLALTALLLSTLLARSAQALSQRGWTYDKSLTIGSEGSGVGQLKDPQGVAVNEETGTIYVVDSGNNRIDVFSAKGEFEEAWGWGVENGEKKWERCTKTTTCQKGLAGHGKGELHGARAIAVDNSDDESKGDIYVEAVTPYEEVVKGHEVEFEKGIVDKFNAKGEILKTISGWKGGEKIEEPHGLTVSPAGELWIYDEDEAVVLAGDKTNKFLKTVETELAEGEARPGIAVNGSGEAFFGHTEAEGEDEPTVIAEDLLITESEETFGEPIFTALDRADTTGLTYDKANGDVILDLGTSLASYDAADSVIQRFGSGEQGVSQILHEGAGLAVDPAAGEGELLVADAASGTIQVFAAEPPGAPQVDEASAGNTTANGAELTAVIDPAGAKTEYEFRYSTETVPSASDPCTAPCEEAPATSGVLGAEGQFEDVTSKPVAIEGLKPHTTYHYVVVAKNRYGTGESAELKFRTQAQTLGALLPDGRQWQLVSAPNAEKNGGFIEANPREGGVIQAAADGDSITYISSNAIDGAQGNRSPEWNQIYSTRGSSGWSSEDLTTPVDRAEGFKVAYNEYRFFSSDLSEALLVPFGEEPTEDPPLSSKATERTVYQRHDQSCASAPASCYAPLVSASDVTGEEEVEGVKHKTTFGASLKLIAADESGEQAILGTPKRLTDEASASSNLYEWNESALKLVSIGEHGEPLADARVGYENAIVRGAVSEGGSRVVFTVVPRGGNVRNEEGHLYLRDLAAGKTIRVDEPAVGITENPSLSHPVYQTASRDGSEIFFTDEERLTSTSHATTEKPDLYVCHVEEEPELHCDVTDLTSGSGSEAGDVQGILPGASEDGSDVFFVADGSLVPGAPRGTCHANEMTKAKLEEEPEAVEARPLNATCDLYVEHDEGGTWTTPKLVAQLSAEDEPDWSASEITEDLGFTTSRVSPNGEWFAFMSDRDLAGYDTRDAASGRPDEEVYLYNATNGSLVCGSCNPTGERPHGVYDHEETGEGIGMLVDRRLIWTRRWIDANVPGWDNIDVVHALHQPNYLTDEGRLFFNSVEKLVPQDENGAEDVYEYEPSGTVGPAGTQDCRTSTETFSEDSEGCISLISGGTSLDKESAFLDASESGNDVFFETAAPLVGLDKDTSYDVYDASVCGLEGTALATATHVCMAEPQATPPACKLIETCRTSPPSDPTLESTGLGGLVRANTGGSARHEVLATKVQEAPKKAAKPTRAQEYAKALQQCRKMRNRHKRKSCEATAKRKYGPVGKKADKSSRGKR